MLSGQTKEARIQLLLDFAKNKGAHRFPTEPSELEKDEVYQELLEVIKQILSTDIDVATMDKALLNAMEKGNIPVAHCLWTLGATPLDEKVLNTNSIKIGDKAHLRRSAIFIAKERLLRPLNQFAKGEPPYQEASLKDLDHILEQGKVVPSKDLPNFLNTAMAEALLSKNIPAIETLIRKEVDPEIEIVLERVKKDSEAKGLINEYGKNALITRL